jgi:hypothetical protein
LAIFDQLGEGVEIGTIFGLVSLDGGTWSVGIQLGFAWQKEYCNLLIINGSSFDSSYVKPSLEIASVS